MNDICRFCSAMRSCRNNVFLRTQTTAGTSIRLLFSACKAKRRCERKAGNALCPKTCHGSQCYTPLSCSSFESASAIRSSTCINA